MGQNDRPSGRRAGPADTADKADPAATAAATTPARTDPNAHARPPVMTCNLCQAVLPAPERLDTRSLPGIELAFKSHCAACAQDTWAVRGQPNAVRAFYTALEKAAGSSVELGSAKPPLSS